MLKHQAQTYKAGNTGAMICFFPGRNFAEDLAIPGASESPDDLHLTLAYLGEAKDIEHPERLLNFVASFALAQFPIRGKLNGMARFVGTDNDKDPAVCLYDSPALPQFRQDLVNGLKGVGIYPVENHGFIPHITLDYISPEKPMDYTVAPLPLNFYAVWVVLGETRFEYQLTGENMSEEWVKRTLTSEPLAVTGLTIMESIVALQGEEDEVLGLFVKGDQFYVSVGDWVTQATLDAVMEVLPGVEVEAEAPPPGDGWTQLWPPVMAAKAGARNSRIDLRRIQAVHDTTKEIHNLMVELGANCDCRPEPYPMKSAADDTLVLRRGTSSSGNWGHIGRPGKKGGSGGKGTGKGISGDRGGRASETNINRILSSSGEKAKSNPRKVLEENGFRVTSIGYVGDKSRLGKDPVSSDLDGLEAFKVQPVLSKKQGGSPPTWGIFRNGRFEKVPKKSLPNWEYLSKSAANGESKNLSSQNYAGLIGLSQAMVKKK